ncbi:hypothetical protein BC938DRAFT_477518 [Jimgerdemannia flammicorona]|uniref:Uncharacterized protein n=1 Tax=Jimgerdemannia flammicorona TaxID=994334 RepID=A0A433QYT3_9FUNG|nr:hypothetical protein BC938DRAFT_477518 [Jimgerdemannia flammicorona]
MTPATQRISNLSSPVVKPTKYSQEVSPTPMWTRVLTHLGEPSWSLSSHAPTSIYIQIPSATWATATASISPVPANDTAPEVALPFILSFVVLSIVLIAYIVGIFTWRWAKKLFKKNAVRPFATHLAGFPENTTAPRLTEQWNRDTSQDFVAKVREWNEMHKEWDRKQAMMGETYIKAPAPLPRQDQPLSHIVNNAYVTIPVADDVPADDPRSLPRPFSRTLQTLSSSWRSHAAWSLSSNDSAARGAPDAALVPDAPTMRECNAKLPPAVLKRAQPVRSMAATIESTDGNYF